jgi:GNAT superfamily N-acetyltransferase
MHAQQDYRIREFAESDRDQAVALLDAALGAGFWDPKSDFDYVGLVAILDGRLVGILTARLEASYSAEAGQLAPVGHIRLVAVDASARHRGIATALVKRVSEVLESEGAGSLLAYAWVHDPLDIAPLAGALLSAGFTFERRIEGFYAGFRSPRCPACGKSPCACPADVFRRVIHDTGR